MDTVNSSKTLWQSITQPDVVDWTAFSEDVLRFESKPETPRVPIPFHIMLVLLRAIAAAGDALDVLKKGIFYGKLIDEEVLEFAVFRACTAMNKALNHDTLASLAYRPGLSVSMRELHALLGMVTEAGELANALERALSSETPLDTSNVIEELGDFDWYKAVYLDEKNIRAADVHAVTQAKLARRYGAQYHDRGATQRDLPAERAVIEAAAGASTPSDR